MQRHDFRSESALKALVSMQAILAVLAMVAFYCTIVVPDRAILTNMSDNKEAMANNSGDVVKDARKLKPWKLMEKNNLVEAVKSAQIMLQRSNPTDASAAYCAAMVFRKSGSTTDAYNQMRRALSLAPRNQELRLEYARMLVDSNKIEEAIAQYRLVLKDSPKLAGPHMDIAQLYMMNDRPADAAAELAELVKIAPNNAAAHKLRGIALARAGRAQDGMDEYLTGMVTEHGAGRPEAVNYLLDNFGDMDKAKFKLEQQAESNPEDPMPKLRLAEISLYADRPSEAKTYLLDARKLAPNNPEVHRSLCVAYKRLGDNRQALTAFMQSIALEQEQAKKNQQRTTQ